MKSKLQILFMFLLLGSTAWNQPLQMLQPCKMYFLITEKQTVRQAAHHTETKSNVTWQHAQGSDSATMQMVPCTMQD